MFWVGEQLEVKAVDVAEVGVVLRELVGRVLSEFSGKAADRFEEQWVGFELFLERGGAVLWGGGEKVREWALQVQYLKLMTLYGLNLLLAEMAWAVAMAALSFGAGVGAWLAFRFAVMRFLLRSWWGQLFVRLAMAEVAGVGVQLVLDPAVQGTQIAMGTRKPDEWDEKATVDAVGVGAVSGLFALPMAALGNVVGNAVSGVLVRGLGGAVDEEVLVAAARHAVAEHAEKYPISAMARFADAVGQSVKDYGGMSLGGMWAARVGSGLGEAIGEGLTEMFGEWAYTGEFNVFSGTAGSFDRVGEWVGEMGGLGLAGSLLPGGGSPYVASGAGSGSDSDLAPLVGKPSDLDDDAGDDSGYDSGYGSGGDSDAESVWSDEGSGSGSGGEVSGPLGGGAGWSTGPGLGAGAGAGVGESVSAGGGVSGPGGSSTAGAVAGASAGGLAGGSETSGGPSKGAAPAVGGGVSAAAQPGPGTGPVESSGGPGVSPVGGVTGAVPVSQGSVSQGSVSSGTGPAAGGAAGGEHGHGPGVSGSGAVAGVGAVPAASVDGGPVVSSAGSRTGGVVDPATNAGEVWAGDVEGVRSQTPPPPYTEFDTGAFSAPDVSVPPPAYSETEPGTVHSGQDGSGVDSAVGAGDGSGAQTSVPGAVPVGGATAVGSGAAPSLAGLPSGGTEGARVVRVPEPTTGAGTEGVSAEQVRAQLGTGVPSAGGPVVVASQAASGGGVVMSPEQAKTLARELNNDVVVLTPGRRGPRWMRFPANAADGLAVRPSKPDTSPTATRTDLGSLTHASTAAPETAKTPTPTPTGPETVTATADGSTGHTTTTMAAGKPGDLARPADRESTADRRGAGASRKPVTARGHGRSVTLDEGRFPKDESALTVCAAGWARGRGIEGRLLSGEALDAALAARRGGDRRPLRLVACDSAVGGWESDAGRAAVRSGLPVLGVRGWVWQAKRGGRYPEGMASAAMVDGSGRPVLPPNGGYVLFVPGKPEPYDLGSYVPVSLGEVVAAVAAGDMARLDELIANAEATAITAAAVGRMSTTGDAHAAEVYNGADTDWAHWADTDTSHTATGEQTLAQQRVVLGAALKRLRKAKKLAQRDIATWLKEGGEDRGAQSTVSLVESGRYPPNRRELLIMLNAYGVSREERARLQALHDAVDSTRSAPESDRKRAELGNKLKEFREAARLTKAGAARAASLRVKQGGNAISRIENGGIPEKEQLRALLEVYRVPEEEREELEALRDAVDPTRLSGVLGARLKLLRERAKLSQCGAAAVSGVSRTRISAGETGRAVPSVEQLGALLNVYDVSSEVRAEVEALWREAVASGGDGAAVPGAGEGHAGDGGPEAELLRELDSLLRWLHAAPEVLPGLRVQLDEFRADVAELVVRGWPVPYVEAQLGVVRGLAERVRSSAFGFSEEEVRRLGWEVLLGHVEVARESLLQWDEGSVARWFAAADEFLGPWRAYEPLRVLMAHHFMLSPGDQAGAEALREQFRPYVPGGVRGGAGPEPDGDGVSRSPVQAAEGMASDGLEGPADAVREENRQAMLARLEQLAGTGEDGAGPRSAVDTGDNRQGVDEYAGSVTASEPGSESDSSSVAGVEHIEEYEHTDQDDSSSAPSGTSARDDAERAAYEAAGPLVTAAFGGREESAAAVFQEHREAIGRWLVKHAGTPRAVHEFTAMWNELERPEPESAERRAAPDEAVAAFRHLSVWARELHGSVNLGAAIAAGAEQVRDAARATLNLPGSELVGEAGARAARVAAAMEEMVAYRSYEDGMTPGAAQAPEFASKLRDTYRRLLSEDAFQQESEVERFLSFYAAPLQRATTWLESLGTAGREMAKRRDQARELFGADFADLARSDAERNLLDDLVDLVAHRNVGAEWETPPDELRALARDMREDFEELRWVVDVPAPVALDRVLHARWHETVEVARTTLGTLTEGQRTIAYRLASAFLGEPQPSRLSADAHAAHAAWLYDWAVRYRGTDEAAKRFSGWNGHVLAEMRVTLDWPSVVSDPSVQYYRSRSPVWAAARQEALRAVRRSMRRGAEWLREQARTLLAFPSSGPRLSGELARRRIGLQRRVTEILAWNLEVLRDPALVQPKAVRIRAELDRIDEVAQDGSAARGVHAMIDAYEASTEDAFVSASLGLALVDVDFGQYRDDGGRLLLASRFGLPGAPYGPAERALLDDLVNLLAVRMASGMPESAARDLAESLARDSHMPRTRTNPPDYIAREIVERLADEAGLESAADGSASAPGADAEPPAAPSWLTEINAFREQYARFFDELWADAGARSLSEVEYATKLGHSVFGDLSGLEAAAAEVAEDLVLAHGELMRRHGDGFEESGPERADAFRADWGSEFHTGLRAVAGKVLGQLLPEEPAPESVVRAFSRVPRWRESIDEAYAELHSLVPRWLDKAREELGLPLPEPELSGGLEYEASKLRDELAALVAFEASGSPRNLLRLWQPGDDIKKFAEGLRQEYQEVLTRATNDPDGALVLEYFRDDCRARVDEAKEGLDKLFRSVRDRWIARGREQLGGETFLPELSEARSQLLDDLAVTVGHRMQDRSNQALASAVNLLAENDSEVLETWRGQGHADLGAVLAQSALERDASDWVARLAGYAPHLRADIRSALHALATVEADTAQYWREEGARELVVSDDEHVPDVVASIAGYWLLAHPWPQAADLATQAREAFNVLRDRFDPPLEVVEALLSDDADDSDGSLDYDSASDGWFTPDTRDIDEIDAYVDARAPMAEGVWKGADGRDRPGDPQTWRDWIEHGEELYAWLEKARRMGWWRGRLLARIAALKAEYRLGMTGELAEPHESEPRFELAAEPPYTPEHVANLRDSFGTYALEVLLPLADMLGDGLGDLGAASGVRRMARSLERDVRRFVTAVHDLSARAERDGSVPAQEFESLVRWAGRIQSFVSRNLDGFGFLHSDRDAANALPRVIHSDIRFNVLLAASDIPGRLVSTVRPRYAFDAAVVEVDPNALRRLQDSIQAEGLLWRVDRELLFRKDSRTPAEIKEARGFAPRSSDLAVSLWGYQQVPGESGLVSVSRSESLAAEFRMGGVHYESEYVYEIDALGGIDLVATLGRWTLLPYQQEVVFPGGILWEFVRGWRMVRDGKLGEFTPNPDYDPRGASPSESVSSPEPSGAPMVVRADGDQGFVVGVPGVSYPGPNRPDVLSDRSPQEGPLPPVVNRGDFEIEIVDGTPHVRLYTVVSMPQLPDGDVASGKPPAADVGDVQQDPSTGKILILNARLGRPLSVFVGRPLSALQVLAAAEAELAESQPWRSAVPPVIRSYLVPVDVVRELSGGAVAPEAYPNQANGRVANVWPEFGPNLFAVPQSLVGELAASVAPNSLVTYTSGLGKEELLRGEWAGAVEHIDGLRERLGVPRTELLPEWRPWPTMDELDRGSTWRVRRVGRGLRRHYATWQEVVSQPGGAPSTLPPDESVPFEERKVALEEFVARHLGAGMLGRCVDHGRGGSCVVDEFMESTVRPWADQAAIAEVLAEDHGRMLKDLNITGKGAENDFAALREQRPEREAHQRRVGARITEMWRDEGASPHEIIDYLVAKFPELSHKYDEITVWNERYTYYEHAQMVLGQYLKLARAEAAEDRLVPVDTVVKAILFHDIEKDNAKRQQRSRFEQYRDEFADFGRRGEEAAAEYGDEMARIAREAGAGRHDAAAEHVLAVDMVRRYGGIFADDRQLAIAVDLIDSDPFGFYLMGRHSADDVFEYIARMALRVSGDSGASFGSVPELAESSTRDIQRLFNEFHQYYQADFSSYTSDSTYRKREGSEPLNGLPTFDRYLGFRDGKLTRTADERHFEYSGRYREKFAELAAMFASPEAVRASYERIAPPASDAQSPSGAQRASDGELEAGPESASTAVGEGVRGRHRRRFSRWLRNCFGADSDSEGQRLEGAAVPTAEVASPSVNEADVRVVRDADGEVALVGFLSREGDEAAVANLARRMPAGGHRTYRAKTRVGPVAVTRRRRVPWPRQRPPLYLYVHGDGVSGRVGGGAVGAAAFARMAWSMKVFQEAAVQQRPIVLLSCDARSNPVRDAGFASELAKEFDKRGHAGGLWSVFGSPMVVDTRGRLDLREGKFVYHGERPASTSGGLRSWLTEFDRGRRSTPAARAIFDGHGRRLSLGESDAVSDMEMASSASRAAPQSGTVDDIEMVASPQQGQRGTEAGPSHGSRQARSIESLSVPEAQRMGLVPHALDYPKRISRAKPKPDPLAENLGVWERIGELRSELGQADGADVDRIRAEIDEQRARLSGMLDAFLAAADAGQLADAIGARLQLIDHLRARRRELVEQGTVLSAPGWEVEHLDEQLVHVADEREVLVSEVAKRRLVDRPYQWMVPGARDLEVVRWLKAFGKTGERPDAELVGASEEQRVVFDGLAGRPGVSWRELSEAQVAALVVVERKGRAQQRRDEERLLARLHRGGEGMEWAKAYPLNDRAEARVLLEDVRRHMNENMLLATNYNFITPRGVLPFMQARPIPDDAPIPLDKICDDPRQEFRSLWEIIKSERDFFLLRRGAHEERLGYAATLQWDRAERMFRPDRDQRAQLPKYAALVSAYQTDGSAGDRYGAFVMYWEPEVANRATYTPADSIAASGAAGINGVTGANNKLGLLAEASPDVVRLAFAQATDFRHESEEFAEWVRNEGYNPDYIPGTYHGEYIEAQIHGSLRWTDLAAVVINYRDSLEDGAPTLQEAERVRTRLLAHARKHAYGFTVVLHKIGDPPPGPELFDQIKARADVRQAADRGEPISAVELAAKYGKDLSWAFEQIFAVVRADVRQAARQRRPRAVDSLVERFAISPEDAEEQIAIDAREDLRRVADKCPEDHYIDAAVNAPKFGKDPQWLEDRIADAARADVREAADAGRPYTKEDLAKRWKRSHKWANDQIKAALAAAIREAADQGTLLTSDDWGGSYQEWVTRYNVHITLVRDSTSAAVRADVREAAEHGSPHRRAELIRKYGPRHHWHLAGYRYALPNHDRVPVGSPPNRQESDARAEVRASVDRGEPYPVEALAKRYGKSRRWAFEQIAAAAHADVLDAADRGEPYSVEALAERYGMSRRWAASRLRGAHALVRGRYARAWEDASSTAASGSPRTAVELAELHGITVEQAQEQIDNAATGDAYRAAKRGAPYTAATLSRRYGMKGASGVLWAQRRIEVAAYEYARLLESTGAVSAFWLQHHFNLPESQAQQVLARAARANVREAADRGEPYTDDEVLDMYSTPDGTPTELAWVRTQVSLAAQADVREAAARGRPYTAEELAKKYGRDEVWAQAQIEAAAREAMREAIASGEPCDAVEFFERFGVPVRWAKEQIEYLRNMPEHSDADTEVG